MTKIKLTAKHIDELKKEWGDLSAQIKKHDHLYHSLDSPIISDAEYDQIREKLNLLKKDFPNVDFDHKISNKVGFTPSPHFKKQMRFGFLLLFLCFVVFFLRVCFCFCFVF